MGRGLLPAFLHSLRIAYLAGFREGFLELTLAAGDGGQYASVESGGFVRHECFVIVRIRAAFFRTVFGAAFCAATATTATATAAFALGILLIALCTGLGDQIAVCHVGVGLSGIGGCKGFRGDDGGGSGDAAIDFNCVGLPFLATIASTAAAAASASAGWGGFVGLGRGVGVARVSRSGGIGRFSRGMSAGRATSAGCGSLCRLVGRAFGAIVAAFATAIAVVAVAMAAFATVAAATALGAVARRGPAGGFFSGFGCHGGGIGTGQPVEQALEQTWALRRGGSDSSGGGRGRDWCRLRWRNAFDQRFGAGLGGVLSFVGRPSQLRLGLRDEFEAGLDFFQARIVVAQALDVVVWGFQILVGDKNKVYLQARLNLGDVAALLVQQEGCHVHRDLRMQGGSAFLHGFFLKQSQYLQGAGFGIADHACTVTARAGDV